MENILKFCGYFRSSFSWPCYMAVKMQQQVLPHQNSL